MLTCVIGINGCVVLRGGNPFAVAGLVVVVIASLHQRLQPGRPAGQRNRPSGFIALSTDANSVQPLPTD